MTELTAERLRELIDYDPVTGIMRWRAKSSSASRVTIGDVAGRIGMYGYRLIVIDSRPYRASRLAFLYMIGLLPDKQVQVDHINREPADDRWSNLRLASGTQNRANTGRPRRNTTGFKGVFRCSKCVDRWRAQITVNRRAIHLGQFPTKEAAAEAYARAAEFHFGEFARAV